MNKPKKIEVNGKTYDLTDLDTLNVREKMTVAEIPIPDPLERLRKMDVPVTSPYYDRLRSLNNQMDFVPYGSPEYHYINSEIAEMERRARKRLEMEKNNGK